MLIRNNFMIFFNQDGSGGGNPAVPSLNPAPEVQVVQNPVTPDLQVEIFDPNAPLPPSQPATPQPDLVLKAELDAMKAQLAANQNVNQMQNQNQQLISTMTELLQQQRQSSTGQQKKNIDQILAEVQEISHVILMQMLPALVEEDLESFGRAINHIQTAGFKRREVELQSQPVLDIMNYMRDNGASGSGWRPRRSRRNVS